MNQEFFSELKETTPSFKQKVFEFLFFLALICIVVGSAFALSVVSYKSGCRYTEQKKISTITMTAIPLEDDGGFLFVPTFGNVLDIEDACAELNAHRVTNEEEREPEIR